jgi:hypothetical protein
VTALKFKCFGCYSCPCCKNILITRATALKPSAGATLLTPISSDPATPDSTGRPEGSTNPPTSPPQAQKVFYLMCGFCHWTTRESGIPDAVTSKFKIQSENQQVKYNKITNKKSYWRLESSRKPKRCSCKRVDRGLQSHSRQGEARKRS